MKSTVVLVGIAGSDNAFSLSVYNIKGYILSDYIIRDNWNVQTLQYPLINLEFEDVMCSKLSKEISGYDPDLVAFSCYMWNINIIQKVSTHLLKHSDSPKICWGGPEISLDYIKKNRFNKLPAHIFVSGEGEVAFKSILTNFKKYDYTGVDGVSWRKSIDDKLSINNPRVPINDMNEIPSPFLSGVVDDSVLKRNGLEASVETQRGCSLRCSYCIYHKDMGKIAYSNIDRVLLEINFLINKGVKKVRIVDANFTSNISYAKQLIRGFIKARFKLKVMFELIPGFIDEEFAYLLSQYNSIYEWNDVTIGVGVQTINLDVLKKIKRRIKIEKFELTFGLLQKYNIYTKIDLIIGLPGENIDSIERTLDYMMDKLMSSNSHLLCCHVMRGLPGTDLLDIAKEYDMVFSSEFEPHEFIESPLLPRCDMLTTLRRTAIIFRLVNHNGWSNKEFISGSDDDSVSIKDKFFCVKQCLEITNIDLVDLIVDGVSKYLEGSNSDYVKDDFPRAETWWWVYSKQEVPNSFILRYLDQLCRC